MLVKLSIHLSSVRYIQVVDLAANVPEARKSSIMRPTELFPRHGEAECSEEAAELPPMI